MAAAETEAVARLPIPTRSLTEIMGSILDGRIEDIRTAFPGKVNSFDRTKKTAEIAFQLDLGLDEIGNDLTPPPIPGVPVVFPGAYWDVQPGETGLVLVTWKNMQNWLLTGTLLPPEDTGVHELSSCCFLPGLWPFPTAQMMTLPTGAKVVPLESGLIKLLLAAATAAEGLVKGTSFNTHMQTYLAAHSTWVTAVGTAVPVLGPPENPTSPSGVMLAAISALQAALATDISSEVFIP